MRVLIVMVIIMMSVVDLMGKPSQSAAPQQNPTVPPSVNKRPAKKQANDSTNKTTNKIDPSPVPAVKTTPETQPCKCPSYNPFEDNLYRWYLRATIVGVVAALAGLGLVNRTAKAAKASADALINAERPWIAIKIGKSKHPQPISSWTWIIINCGRTPAHISVIKSIRGIQGERAFEYPNSASQNFNKLMAPGEDREIDDIFPSQQFSTEEKTSHDQGNSVLWYYILIEYTDTFNPAITHISEYRHFIRGSTDGWVHASESANADKSTDITRYT
jgi:hypothetical protein